MPETFLSPHGTARERFTGQHAPDEVAALFASLRAATSGYDLSPEDLFVAEELVRLSPFLGAGGTQTRALCFVVIASLIAATQGSTRLPIGGDARGPLGRMLTELVKAAGLDIKVGPLWRDVRALCNDHGFARLIGHPGESAPLVSADGCIYQQRLLASETSLALHARPRTTRTSPLAGGARDAAARAATAGRFPLSAEQTAAVELALTRALAVIAGGPGTGKTAIAAALVRAARDLGIPAEAIALAAPTGKAAQRLGESLRAGLGDDVELAAPSTLHRLLGFRPGGGFRHHENHPVAARLVIVDEASMIDLLLMERLFRALHPEASLVLLGDADQLPSVDAGAVFRDLVAAGHGPGEGAGDGPARYAARLTHSYRMDASDPDGLAIFELSRAVSSGAERAMSAIADCEVKDLPFAGVTRATRSDPRQLDACLRHWLDTHVIDPALLAACARVFPTTDERLAGADEEVVAALIRAQERVKVLTATRRLSAGSQMIANRLHVHLRERLGRAPDELGAGEPLHMSVNDYRRGLFNGDGGIVIQTREGDGPLHLRVAFVTASGVRLFPLEALRGTADLGHAITIHRSQGSEYDHVLVVVPDRPLPILTRELLYTAVTRARRSVTLFGSVATYRAAIRRRVERYSGVAARLVP